MKRLKGKESEPRSLELWWWGLEMEEKVVVVVVDEVMVGDPWI